MRTVLAASFELRSRRHGVAWSSVSGGSTVNADRPAEHVTHDPTVARRSGPAGASHGGASDPPHPSTGSI